MLEEKESGGEARRGVVARCSEVSSVQFSSGWRELRPQKKP